MPKKIESFNDLAQKITSLLYPHQQEIIAIDGGGGAGKTTFAIGLQQCIPNSYIVKIDDFYRPPQLRSPVLSTKIINPNFDWDRFETLVLKAFKNDKDIIYRLYNFDKGALSDKVVHIPHGAIVIVEGVWSMQDRFIDMYDYRIWLEAPDELRLKRGVGRDGEEFRRAWEEEWIPIDQHYREVRQPHLRADCVIDSEVSILLKIRLL